MKYQSELIKEIVESRGHKMSSIHYESECAETWIEEAKGAYPKLCDYESEWLNYISILDDTGGSEDPEPPIEEPEPPKPEPPIGEFPYVVLSDVTEATVDNVVPYAYKSAILKGQTLVNIADVSTMVAYNGATILDGTIILDRNRNNSLVQISSANKLIQSGKKYIAILNEINGNTQGVALRVQHASNAERIDFINNKAIFIADTYASVNRWVYVESTSLGPNAGTTSFKWSIIEYQNGMENWDIPYFEGMQTVKVPVLTTSNEEGTKTNILTVNEKVTLRGIGDVKDELNLLTGELTQRIGERVLDGSEEWIQDSSTQKTTISAYVSQLIDTNQANSTNIICERFQAKNINTIDEEGIYIHRSKGFRLRISINKLSSPDINGFKTYLQSNPVTVQYLATESIKTVGLSIQDQGGNTLSKIKPIEGTMVLSTSSDTIKPLFSGEIPVEAITQNLASFIDLETEE